MRTANFDDIVVDIVEIYDDIVEIIASGMDWKQTTSIAYLDIHKVFDIV